MTLTTQARILALGEYRPERLVTNAELPSTLDTNDEWIRERTGIQARRIAGADETVVSMAAAAAGKALATAGIDPVDVGLVVLATCSMPTQIPGGAAQVAQLLGTTAAGAFDVNAACAGFCYGLSVAAGAIQTGSAQHVVVIGAEKLSDWVDWNDRRTAIIFADGAGAAVVGPAAKSGIGPVEWGSDGKLSHVIAVPPGGKLLMDGPAVFRWTTTTLAAVARRACSKAGITPDELAAVVPHQANLRIISALARQIGATNAVIADDIVEAGNTSSASIPLALSRLLADGRVRSGDPVLTLGFGAGLTWAGHVIEVP